MTNPTQPPGVPAPPDAPPPPDRPPGEKKPPDLIAIAALVTAGTGALSFLVGFIGLPAAGVDSPAAGVATVTTTAPATAVATVMKTVPAPSESSEKSTSSPDSTSLRRSGALLIAEQFDLDSVPPEPDLGGDISVTEIDGRQAIFTGGRPMIRMASIPEEGKPDAARCTLLVKTQPQVQIPLSAGGRLCLLTDEGRPALVTVNTVNGEATSADIDVLVWQKPE